MDPLDPIKISILRKHGLFLSAIKEKSLIKSSMNSVHKYFLTKSDQLRSQVLSDENDVMPKIPVLHYFAKYYEKVAGRVKIVFEKSIIEGDEFQYADDVDRITTYESSDDEFE